MKFDGVKCDECGVIKGENNHWVELYWEPEANILVIGGGFRPTSPYETHDLCGQQCALKHVAKLLGWSSPTEPRESDSAPF